jgi:hypothetical protein
MRRRIGILLSVTLSLMLVVVLSTAVACSSSPVAFFPVQKSGFDQMTALFEGRLELVDGYLRVVDSHSSYLAIWPHGFSVRTEGDEIQVLDGDGQVVAIVGEAINVGGGEGANVEIVEKYIGQSLPEGCTGPFWIVSVVVSANDSGGPVTEEEPINGEGPEAFWEIYAEQFGVTVDEAMRRFELQDMAGELDAELSWKEAETFAGLWIEHTPEFKVVVLFTGDAEETIKPYLQSYPELAEIIEVRTARMSLVELQAVQYAFTDSLIALGIPADSEVNVYENRVKVYVTSQVRFDIAIFEGKLRLPDCVDVIIVEALAEPT